MRKVLGKTISKIILSIFQQKRIKEIIDKGEILSVFYHRPNKVEFERWIKWCIENGFNFISTDKLIEIIDGRINESKKLIWLTFDDGWRNNYTEILPILVKYKVPATIFVSTNLVSDGVFWLELARMNQDKLAIPVGNLKKISETERRQVLHNLCMNPGFNQMEREFMTWEELHKISKEPLISIGNHTHNHVICTNCNSEQLEDEIKESERLLKQYCINYINAFAYPNGNFNENTQNYLKERFNVISLVEHENLNMGSDVQALTRICLGDKLSMEENVLNMFGFRKKFFRAVL
jgi:poly-beta-1,6-N-acetyl-D-glucosamine N-deacetylase